MAIELSTILGDTLALTGDPGTRQLDTSALVALQTSVDDAQADATQALSDAAAAQADADLALFRLGNASETVRHLYVDPVAGNDVNDGASTATPVQTAARLFALLPQHIYQPTLVHMASGVLSLAGLPVPYIAGSRLLCFYADENWDPRGDLYTIVDTGAAGVGTSGSDIIAAGAQTANAHRCKTIRFTSGNAANGQRRTIARNTTTAYTPCAAFSPAPVAGDTYEVVTSNAVIYFDAQQLVTTSNNSTTPAEGYAFVGVEFDTALNFTALTFGSSYHQFFGCRARANITGISTAGNYGTMDAGAVFTVQELGDQLGLPQTLWDGWAFAEEATALGFQSPLYGLVTGNYVGRANIGGPGRFAINGGFVAGITSAFPSTNINVTGRNATLPTTIGDATDTTVKVNGLFGTIQLQNFARIQNTSATNPAISAERDATVTIQATSIVGENANAAGPDVRCRYGGKILTTFAAAPAFGKATSVWVCESTSANGKTTLTSAGAAIRDAAAPESIIRRVA